MLIHIVEAGETVYGIAARYGVSPARLLSDNGLSASDSLGVAQSTSPATPIRLSIRAFSTAHCPISAI